MIIKCKMCGGDIQFNPGDTCGQCDHCGCTTTFPKLPDEQRTNLFNRANHFRRQCEFDKAMAAYEHILEVDDTDAEAHWGIVLSKFGIEYVEDPVTHEQIPTCHRAQVISILSDEDYQNAIKYAPDSQSREIYEQEAKRIAEIQKGILAISSQEKPYDVFICYKETDDNGSRTKDSTLAQEIYYQLTNEGYKVFFSRITLEDKLGQEYEPYIFAALNSAKVMLVVGTKPENFNAVWVKNEWSRFLQLMRTDRKRLLIPCYRDVDPYDLPEELSSLQSQDMGKIGFMQDLLRGISKVLDAEKKQAVANKQIAAPQTTEHQVGSAGSVTPLLRRAFMFLEDHDWKNADEYAEKVLDLEPDNATAYLAKLMVEREVGQEEELSQGNCPLTESGYYQKALRFADASLKLKLSNWNQAILDRNETKRKTEILTKAKKDIAGSTTVSAVKRSIEPLMEIKGFDGVDTVIAEAEAKIDEINQRDYDKACTLKSNKNWDEAIRAFTALQDYRDSKSLVEACKEGKAAEEVRVKAAEKKRKRIIIIAIVALLVGVALFLLATQVLIPLSKYNQAVGLREKGQYDEAVVLFTELGKYSDAETQILATRYAEGEAKRKVQDWDGAVTAFTAAKNYDDAVTQIKETRYQKADALEKAGDQEAASALFAKLNYKDSSERAYKPYYDKGVALFKAKDWDGAVAAFKAAKNYNDAATQILATRYAEGKTKQEDKDWDGAVTAFTLAKDYSDAATQIQVTRYTEGESKREAKDWDGAVTAFTAAEGYSDASTQIKETRYRQAMQLIDSKDYSKAAVLLANLKGYKDSNDLLNKDPNISAAVASRTANTAQFKRVNSYVEFGTYPQTESGTDHTPIKWQVLSYDNTNNRALLMSFDGLDNQPYNTESKDVTWETCTLRSWLNNDFLNKAFTAQEQDAIATITVDNSNEQDMNSKGNGGKGTQDKIYLLSYAEAHKYLNLESAGFGHASSNVKPRVAPTEYAIKQGASVFGLNHFMTADGRESVTWWLRSTSSYKSGRAVDFTGDVDSENVSRKEVIRPVLWVDLNSDLFR